MSVIILQIVLVCFGLICLKPDHEITLLDKDTSYAVKGWFSIVIVLFHSTSSAYEILGQTMAFPIVTLFSMFSAYGVMLSMNKYENYRVRLYGRIVKIIIPYLVILVVNQLLFGNPITVGLMWTNVILIFYLSAICSSFFKKEHQEFFLIFFWLLYFIIFEFIFPNEYLAWAEQSLGFVYGVILAKYRMQILNIIKQKAKTIIGLDILLVFGFTLLYLSVRSPYFVTNLGILYRNLLTLGCVIGFLVITSFFSVKSKGLEYIGKCCLYIYMFHGTIFSQLENILNPSIIPWVTIIVSVLLAIAVNIVVEKIGANRLVKNIK